MITSISQDTKKGESSKGLLPSTLNVMTALNKISDGGTPGANAIKLFVCNLLIFVLS